MRSAYRKQSRRRFSKKLLLFPAAIVVITAGILYTNRSPASAPADNQQTTAPAEQSQPDVLAEQNKSAGEQPQQAESPEQDQPASWPVTYTLEEAASLTVVVNKKHKLPSDYSPELQSVAGGQLRPEAATALGSLLNAADEAGVPMRIISSYRSYNTQISTYNKWVEIDGQTQADRSSARAGHSEHQTGLAVDLGMPDSSCDLAICFGDTAQGQWLAAHAHQFGFIVRYEATTEAVTGYQYEPWHMRFVGVDVAGDVKNSAKTLDEYYGVPAGGYGN